MSNYEATDNLSNRSHAQSNIGNTLNNRMIFPSSTGLLNQPGSDPQKISNIHQNMTQNTQFYQSPYFAQNYIVQTLPISQLGNPPSYTPIQPQQNMVQFNPQSSNMFERINPQQQFVYLRNNGHIYQSQQGPIQHQISHPIPSHIQHNSPQQIQQQMQLQQHIPHMQSQMQMQSQIQMQQQIQSQQMQQQQQQQQMQSQQIQIPHQMQMQPQMQSQMQQQMQPQMQPHMQQQMQPHIQPQFMHNNYISHNLMPAPFQPPATSVMPMEKPVKMSSALEIINPETNESIDLHKFKLTKNKESSKKEEVIKNKEIIKVENVIIEDAVVHIIDNKDSCDLNNGIVVHEVDIIPIPDDLSDHEPEENIETQVEIVTINLENNTINVIESIDVETQHCNLDNLELDQKFIYTREELIRIGKSSLSRIKPKGLPVKDQFTDPIILDYPMNIICSDNMESMQGMNQKHSKKIKDENILYDLQSNIRSQMGYSNFWRHNTSKYTNNARHIDLGVTELPLSRSEDGYVTFKQRLASGEELNQMEELVRQIKGILNRIVPQNFDQCLSDLVSLKVGTHEGMTCLVNELFLKAVKEEAYSVTFAKICSYLASIKADVSENEIVTFRSVLLQKCQMMFTTPLEEQLEKVRQDWLCKASVEKPKTKALMESDVEEQVKKAKDRYYGNIRFIGELYLKGVLITKIICFCIDNLMSKENDSDSLICLCKLLETCGSKLETELKGKEKLNEACSTLRSFTDSQNIETRVRFRILDILEMRDKKWSLRKIQQEQKIEPKTLEEIKLEKEMEDVKDFYHSLNRRNVNSWSSDRRQSLPVANKNRSNITPKQLSVNSSEPTTLGPQNRNWFQGSGCKPKNDSMDNDRSRSSKLKFKPGVNGRDMSQIVENYDTPLAQINAEYAESDFNYNIPVPLCQSSATSSQNSSRSSSHSRSIPSTLVKEKLPDSKLAQEISREFFNPDQLFQEHLNTNMFCETSWNSYGDKVNVVYQWLDINFETSSDKRRSLSNMLSSIINKGVLDKEDLLKAFKKLLNILEDLLIDVGNALWDSLMDYLIPFIESMELSSIDIIDNIFNTGVFQTFSFENASIIYSLPWSMINGLLKLSCTRINQDIFKLAIDYTTRKELSDCNEKLLYILEINLLKAISIKYKIKFVDYSIWLDFKIKEAVNFSSERFFVIVNWTALLSFITSVTCFDDKLKMWFKNLSSLSSVGDGFQAILNISQTHDQTVQDILCKLWYLIKVDIYDLDTVLSWKSESHYSNLPPNLLEALNILQSKSAFINQSCESFQSFLLYEECDVDCCRELIEVENITATDSSV